MKRQAVGLRMLAVLALLSGPARADIDTGAVIEIAQQLRSRGCAMRAGAAGRMTPDAALAAVAQRLAAGLSLAAALSNARYPASDAASMQVATRGSPAVLRQTLRASFCGPLTRDNLDRLGIHVIGSDVWLVVASRAPAVQRRRRAIATGLDHMAPQLLDLVNRARARARTCGARSFPAVPPLIRSAELDAAAEAHARDMAARGYFDHVAPDGATPTERLARTGYRWSLSGENIAYGKMTPAEVVRGWLASPGHCANVMDARFRETGLGIASGSATETPRYWVQTLASRAHSAPAQR